jgi:hypothetical protein
MDVTSIASAYAAFGGVLAGFAFAGLSFYVTRPPEPDPGSGKVDVLITRGGKPVLISLIPVSAVAAAGFYAMASLGVSTFLYANLAGEGSNAPAGQAVTALLVYGVVLALSVLTLFYFVTLMLFERELTKPAAKPAFWAGTFAGSIVVLRFLAGSARAARLTRCPAGHPCHPGLLYTTPGITILLVVAAVVFAVITLTRVLEWGPIKRLLTPFAHRPAFPSASVFVTAVAVATLASLYININAQNNTYVPPGWLIVMVYAMSVALIILFALGSGAVIYPRIHSIRLTRLAAPADAYTPRHTPWWERARAASTEMNNMVYLQYATGTRPIAGRRQLIWKVRPATEGEPDKLATRFRARHGESPWRLGGQLFLVAGTTNIPNARARVQVTLIIGSGADRQQVEKNVAAGAAPVPLDGTEPSTCDLLQVAVRRLDSSPEDVLLCWLEAGGAIDRPSLEDQSLARQSGREEQPGT